MQTKEELAEALGIKKSTLTFFAYGLADNKKYTSFFIPKRSGGQRRIEAPIPALKNIQKKIASMLKQAYLGSTPYCNHGFGRKRDIITNAQSHLGKRYIFKCDIKDFYPSIAGKRIFGVLTSKPFNYSDEVAHLITTLCTFDDRLPQGAPTSPVLSNMIIRRLDRKLMKFSKNIGGFYTRYADDITISFTTEGRVKQCITSEGDISPTLQSLFEEENFTINQDKNRLLYKRNRQMVTGIIVNDKLNVKRDYITNLRNLIYILNRHGQDIAQQALKRHKLSSVNSNVIPHIEGKLRYLRRVKGDGDEVYLKLALKYANFNPNFVATDKIEEEFGIMQCIIMAEGKTDYMHLEAAFNYFQKSGMYSEMSIDFTPHEKIDGFSDLDRHISKSAGMKLGGLHIAIFDADEKTINNKYPERLHKLSDYLYAFRLPRPTFLDDEEPFCIEMLYTKEDLTRTDDEGRRLYFTSEFNKADSSCKTDPMISVTNISFDKLVIDSKVYRLTAKGRFSVGLTKNDFAKFMTSQINLQFPPDLSIFKNIFDIIRDICTEYYTKKDVVL